MQIDIYTVDYCPYCHKALKFLNARGVEYKHHDITKNETEMRKKLGEMYNIQGDVTVPQIIVDGNRLGGYTDMIALADKNALPF